ncbi:bcl-2-like protein 10 [Pholidichthys leucotaenia]
MSCGLWKETLAVVEDYLSLCCTSPHRSPPSVSAAAMFRLAQDIEKQYHSRFYSLAQTFLRQCGPDLCASLRKVMEELVGDGHLNWGRVVSLFAFIGVLVRQLQEQKDIKPPGLDPGQQRQGLGQGPISCRELAKTIADYLGKEKKDWLLENDGWEGFCKFSGSAREVSQDSSMKTALFAAAGVGLAGLTFLLVR